jgi:hypothetical protein
MYLIVYVIVSLTSHGYKEDKISQEQSMGKKSSKQVTIIKILTRVPL